MRIVTGLWTGKPFNFKGKHYTVKDATLLPRPVQSPRIPVWIGGFWPHTRPLRRAAQWDGLYAGENRLPPETIKRIVSYVKSHRKSSRPFDYAMYGKTPLDRRRGVETVKPYVEAGLTWWLEGVNSDRGSPDEMIKRIQFGPPSSGQYQRESSFKLVRK